MHLHSVAPKELVQADYDVLKSYERLDTSREIEDLLFIQSLEGRAHNGAGVFDKRTYVNTTIDDVVRALGRDAGQIRAARQALIDDIVRFAAAVMNGERRDRLVNEEGKPFLGVRFFEHRRVHAPDILRGLYVGGLRDNPDIRKEAERIYQVKIGGGRCYVIDVKTMLDMDLDGERLAHEPHEADIAEYMKRGLIVAAEGEADPVTQRYFYIRHRVGPGQSDDAAFIMAGILHNPDVALGVFLADAIDTFEKYAQTYRDQDGGLSFQIGRGFKDLSFPMEEVYELVYLAAIPEIEEHLVPDSSLRYLLSIDQRSQQCALKTHFDFVQGRPIVPLYVSFKRILSTQFYEYINRRLASVSKLRKFALPNLTIQELDRPAVEIAKKDFGIVSKDATLADVIRTLKETKCETIIVQDKNNKVLGTISPTDLLFYLNEGERSHA
ncbi:MAG: CBS domain-containing protein [Candidatus Omnitrophica bacterium]|nr:CBS domain-containing protein [Candidatus Omnitrophota bacterium]